MSKQSHLVAAIVCGLLWLVSWPYGPLRTLEHDWWRGPLYFVPIYRHALPAFAIALALTAILYFGIALRNWIGALLISIALMLWYLPMYYFMIKDPA